MPPPKNGGVDNRNPTIRAISVEQRRETLRAILRWGHFSEESLASYLAAQEQGTPSSTDERIQSTHTELVHRHLPSLSDAKLLTWDTQSGTVDTTSHPALSDRRFQSLLRLSSEGVDDVLVGISHEYRRIILTALWEGESESTVPTLARKVSLGLDREGTPETGSVDDIGIALHHAHLPKLAAADLIEYDPQSSRVAYSGHPTLEKVFTIIYEPENQFTEKYGGLLSGLHESLSTDEPDRNNPTGWPHHWSQYNG